MMKKVVKAQTLVQPLRIAIRVWQGCADDDDCLFCRFENGFENVDFHFCLKRKYVIDNKEKKTIKIHSLNHNRPIRQYNAPLYN